MSHKINSEKAIFADLTPQEGVLLHLDTKRYFQMNESAQIIWKGLEKNLCAQSIATQLCDTFEIEMEEAQKDVNEYIQKLYVEQFITLEQPQPSPKIEQARKDKIKGL